jgi:hypothetical protein
MAEDFDTLENDYNDAKAEYEKWNISANENGTYTVEGKTYSPTEFGKLRNKAKSAFQKLEKKYKQARSDRAKATQGSKDQAARLRTELNATKRENIGIAAALADGKSTFNGRPVSQATIDANNQRIAQIQQQLPAEPAPVVPEAPVVPGAGSFRTAEEAGVKKYRKAGGKLLDVKPKEDTTDEGTGGGTGGGVGGVGGGAGTGGKTVVPKNWEAQFRRMFPNQAWLLDIDRAKYPKLFALIQRGVADRMYESQEGLARFDAELRNTDFYVEIRNNDTVRQIKSLVGDLGFDTVPFNKFLTTAANMGWKGDTLQQEVYKEAFRKNDAGQYVNPTAVTRAKASNNYLQIANIGKAYFSQVADTTVENALTGVITGEDVQRQQRELAKTKYGHLSNLLEQGFSLQELADPFRQQAAQLLERSADDINMGEAMFEAAYNYGDTGQKRMMTSGEWEIMLRSDAKYGWDKTNNAKAEARQLASSIAQAFGKVI